MRSHLLVASVSLVACTLGVIGCQSPQQRTTEPMSDAPLVIDEATQKRDFPKTEAVYPNGAVVAGPTWETWQAKPEMPYNGNAAVEAPMEVGNVFMMPFQMFRQKPGAAVTYPGAMIEPSYNAMPQVPSSASEQSQSERTQSPPSNTSNSKGENGATPAVSP
jgi:hypothetical protein